ncbi:uncharacterized protein DS421_19g653310 [Arachis hypogaea]|uniref:Uncharacterized protein n=1 Tax=Arachis hypogaea TaxID=3818 RepID=A0A6B9VBB6_ARAHY|nr:uncharacterized protein DS421_19g653310 [Arachis hypogaea]
MQQQPPPYSKHTHTQLSEEGKKENRHGNQKGRGEGGASPSRRRRLVQLPPCRRHGAPSEERRECAVASLSNPPRLAALAVAKERTQRRETVRLSPSSRRTTAPLSSLSWERGTLQQLDPKRGKVHMKRERAAGRGRPCVPSRASSPKDRRCAMEQTEPHRAVGVLTVAGKGFRPPQVSWSEEEAVPLCFDRREWFCDFRDHRRNFRPSLCHWRTSLPSPENSSVDPPELLAAAGAAVGPVQNRSCFVLKFRAVYAAAKMCGAVL